MFHNLKISSSFFFFNVQQHLTISLGENLLAQNRARRWHDLSVIAQQLNAGPLSSSYLKTSERLDRPVIRTFQRHPGNQVPETQTNARVYKNVFVLFVSYDLFVACFLGHSKSSTISRSDR